MKELSKEKFYSSSMVGITVAAVYGLLVLVPRLGSSFESHFLLVVLQIAAIGAGVGLGTWVAARKLHRFTRAAMTGALTPLFYNVIGAVSGGLIALSPMLVLENLLLGGFLGAGSLVILERITQ